ncbi:MAG: gliding motility-associated C-terminal domain-containing protein, partial [Saprospiraceae bacterium]
TYGMTVTDSNGCSQTDVMTLNPRGSISINALVTKQVSCFAANDAALFLDIFAPTNGPYNVSWKNAAGVEVAISQTVANIGPGVYSVEVSDKDGCSNSAQNIVVTEPAPIVFSTAITNAPCFQSNGRATITISGNPTGYKYEWRIKDSLTVIDTDHILDAKAGSYTVKVIHPNNCTKDTNIIITEPTKITFPIPETRKVTCFGLSTGQAAIIGAPTGISFSWSTGAAGQFATNFREGRAWVLGSLGSCVSDTTFFNIDTEPRLTIDTAKTVKTLPLCFGSADGSLKVEALGGTNIGYNYNWANGTTGPQLNNLAAGVYTVTITDSNNCAYTDSITLGQPTRMIPAVDPLKTVELNCKNRDAGKIGLQVSGGNPGKKTITWQSGILTDNEVAIGLSSGRYCATVTDNFGCSATFCYQLSDASPLVGKIKAPAQPLCNGGKTCIAVDFITGGTGNKYTFQLNNGIRFPIDTCLQVFAGQYFINLIDSAGCSIDTTITISQPDPITVDLGPDLDVQLGASSPTIRVSINSPAGIGNVIWSPTEGIECIVSNCFSVQANPTTTTTYRLTATDQNGCTGSDEITINVKNIRNVFFPNIFSPNRDGVNDHFQAITGSGVEKIITFVIFDRWGNKVFEKNDYVPDPTGTDGWDGTHGGRALDPGVYVYYSLARFDDGKDIEYSGSVTLADKVRN